jgi:hypothetical protein
MLVDDSAAVEGMAPAEFPWLSDILSTVTDDSLRRLYSYWNERRGARRFPGRRDIDPLEFAYVLGWVTLVDVTYNPTRFRFRLYGSELAHRIGLDLTGTYADQHPNREFGAMLQQAWQEVLDRREPVAARYDRLVDNSKQPWEAIRMPLSSDGATIDMLLAASRPVG